MDCCNDSGGDNVNDDNINDWNNIVIIDIIDKRGISDDYLWAERF